MPKVVSFKICPFVQRVTAALEARNIDYDVEYISLSSPPAWFANVSPNAQVPVLIADTGAALFESDAIVEYIEDRYGPLQPGISAEQRAVNRAWSYQAGKHYLVQCSTMQSADRQTLLARTQNLGQAFARIEKALNDGMAVFGGDSPTIGAIGNVDIAWLPLLHRADIVARHTRYDMLDGYPRVQAWQRALLAQPLAERSVCGDFEEEFTDFYLSDRTWLGRGEDAPDAAGGGRNGAKTGGGCC